jgi:glycosyltransferase involved in cell wall biosynthesis
MKKVKVSAIIIAKNEEENIRKCISSIKWADEIVVVDTGSVDETASIAKSAGAKVVDVKKGNYSIWRNSGAKKATNEWLFYIDADETVTEKLKEEIIKTINSKKDKRAAYAIPRENIILGKVLKHGGWWPDYVIRLIRKNKLEKWQGELHEQPVIKGEIAYLENPLVHKKHDNLFDMLEKTNKWSDIEAKLYYESHHPKMVGWRFFRVMFSELWLRLIKKRGFLDGAEGIIYSIYQMWSKFVTYAKLWELQIKKETQ